MSIDTGTVHARLDAIVAALDATAERQGALHDLIASLDRRSDQQYEITRTRLDQLERAGTRTPTPSTHQPSGARVASKRVLIHAEHADMRRRLAALAPCCGTCQFWQPNHTCQRFMTELGDPNPRYQQRMAFAYNAIISECHEPMFVLTRE